MITERIIYRFNLNTPKLKLIPESIKGGREAVSRFSFRVLAGAWVLCAMVLVNSYTGIVTSALTTPRMKQPINTLEELAVSNEVKIVLRSDTAIGVQILVKPSNKDINMSCAV